MLHICEWCAREIARPTPHPLRRLVLLRASESATTNLYTKQALKVCLLVLGAVSLSACVTIPMGESCRNGAACNTSAMHRMEPSENLDQVAAEFNTTRADLCAYNKLSGEGECAPGTILKIPPRKMMTADAKRWWMNPIRTAEGSMSDVARVLGPKKDAACARIAAVPKCVSQGFEHLRGAPADEGGRMPVDFVAYDVCARPNQVSGRGMSWPVVGKVSRPFDDKTNHRGLDICAPEGTGIGAAASGKVIYSGNKLAGFGNLVIIDHGDGLATVYAHNRKNLVKPGDSVKRGQQIAYVGQTGNATTPHCHFEVRKGAQAVNPRTMLP